MSERGGVREGVCRTYVLVPDYEKSWLREATELNLLQQVSRKREAHPGKRHAVTILLGSLLPVGPVVAKRFFLSPGKSMRKRRPLCTSIHDIEKHKHVGWNAEESAGAPVDSDSDTPRSERPTTLMCRDDEP